MNFGSGSSIKIESTKHYTSLDITEYGEWDEPNKKAFVSMTLPELNAFIHELRKCARKMTNETVSQSPSN